jgi:hypothetical protein
MLSANSTDLFVSSAHLQVCLRHRSSGGLYLFHLRSLESSGPALGLFVDDVVSAVSFGVVDERHLYDVDDLQRGVGSYGQVGSGGCCQLGLLGTVGG